MAKSWNLQPHYIATQHFKCVNNNNNNIKNDVGFGDEKISGPCKTSACICDTFSEICNHKTEAKLASELN